MVQTGLNSRAVAGQREEERVLFTHPIQGWVSLPTVQDPAVRRHCSSSGASQPPLYLLSFPASSVLPFHSCWRAAIESQGRHRAQEVSCYLRSRYFNQPSTSSDARETWAHDD